MPKKAGQPPPQRAWLPLFLEFIKNIRINSKETDSGLLVPYGAQLRYLEEICQGLDAGVRLFLCLKSRQLGISTIGLAIDLFWLMLHPGLQGALITDTEGNRDKFRNILEGMTKGLPPRMRVPIDKHNRNMMVLHNGSVLDFLVAGTRKGSGLARSRAYNFVHGTETAFWGDPAGVESLMSSMAETHPNRLYMFESTANGFNFFKDMWNAAKRDPHTQRAFFIPWCAKEAYRIERDDPRFDFYMAGGVTPEEAELRGEVLDKYGYRISDEQVAWYRWRDATRTSTDGMMDQEFPWTERQAFVLTGSHFFPVSRLQTELERVQDGQSVRFKAYRYTLGQQFLDSRIDLDQVFTATEAELRIWEDPRPRGKYVIGCDPAYGRNDWKDKHCSDSETELLTRDGWKRYDQITLADQAVCFDSKTGSYAYGPVQDLIIRDHHGPMYHFDSDGMDQLVTPEHRVVSRWWTKMRDGRNSPWDIKTAMETAVAAQNSIRSVPIGGAPIGPGIEGLSLDMCRALGWIITDGYAGRRGGPLARRHIVLTQSTKTVKSGVAIADEMDRVLGGLCEFSRFVITQPECHPPKVVWRIGVDEAEKFLSWLGENIHHIPRRILTDGSREQLEALFGGLLQGDGGWDKNIDKWVKFCPGQETALADAFQELALRLGYSATRVVQKGQDGYKDQWLVRLSTRAAHCIRKQENYQEPYKGVVWCVTVPTGAFVARRNGKAFVTGNCVSVWRCYADRLVQVAEYATDDIETYQVAWVLAHLAGSYRDCIINLEINGPGMNVMQEMDHVKALLRSPGMVAQARAKGLDNAFDNARWYLYHRPDSFGAGYAKGWKTNADNKFSIMNSLRNSFALSQLIVRSGPLLEEMEGVVQDGGDIGAPGRGKDDRVFAAAFAHHAWVEWVRPEMLETGMTFEKVVGLEIADAHEPQRGFIDNIVGGFFKDKDKARAEQEWRDFHAGRGRR